MLSLETIEQRALMAGALEAHHLTVLSGDMYSVTEKGREYIDYRGALQALSQG